MENLNSINHIHLGDDTSKLVLCRILDVICDTNRTPERNCLEEIIPRSRYTDSLDCLRSRYKKRIDNSVVCYIDNEGKQQKIIYKRKLYSLKDINEQNKCDHILYFWPLLDQGFSKLSNSQDIDKVYTKKLVASDFVSSAKIARIEISTESVIAYAGLTFYRSRGQITFDGSGLKFQILLQEWAMAEISQSNVKSITVYSKRPFIKIAVRTKIVNEISHLCSVYKPRDSDIRVVAPKKSSELRDVILVFLSRQLSKQECEQLGALFGGTTVTWSESEGDSKDILEKMLYTHPYKNELICNASVLDWSNIFKGEFKESNKPIKSKIPSLSPIVPNKGKSCPITDTKIIPVTSTPTKPDSIPNNSQMIPSDPSGTANQFTNNCVKANQSSISLPKIVTITDNNAKDSSSGTGKSSQNVNLHFVPTRNLSNIFDTFHYSPSPDSEVLIHGSDLICLNQDQWLNDNIINFYLSYIRYEVMTEDQRNRTHFFNVFFNTKLRGTEPTDTPELRHARVSKWTKKVDIFDKDFLIIPFNENKHWFVIVVCFPWMAGMISYDKLFGTAQTMSAIPDNNTYFGSKYRHALVDRVRVRFKVDPRPCVLLFDSIRFQNRTPSVKLIREYLKTEWDCKRLSSDGPLVFDKNTIRGFNPQVPQQANNNDCGIFVLHYVEQFFVKPAKSFSKEYFQSSFLDWFDNVTVGGKRAAIQNLVLSKADKCIVANNSLNSSSDMVCTIDSYNPDDSVGPDVQII